MTEAMDNRRGGQQALDCWREPLRGLQISVASWSPLSPADDQFIVRPRNIRMVLGYARQLGPVAVLRKIRSRLAESVRNRKVAAIGAGLVLAAPEGSGWRTGDPVVFFAPNHPERHPRVVCVDERFAVRLTDLGNGGGREGPVGGLPEELAEYVGWSPFSGVDVDTVKLGRGMTKLMPGAATVEEVVALAPRSPVDVKERIEATRPRRAEKPSAVLFGLGNYAKTLIVPYIRRHLDLRCVHELDPDQLHAARRWGVALDTSPEPRETEAYDAWFIAGYHHTHAPLAEKALRTGGYAVVEKPLATTWSQYESLRRVVDALDKRRLFVCFQKRYSKLNEWALQDLGVRRGDPVDMHCIVYEIPLPRRHWYNWPNSGSRIVSNGCHWLDYFLFMNGYCAVEDAGVWPSRGRDVVIFARLENGATLAMSLTDTGSARLGVREVIELRAGNVTVRIDDGAFYFSESTTRVLRRKRINPMTAYRRMYDAICQRIARGEDGDELETLRSTELMLRLEDELRTKGNRITVAGAGALTANRS